MSIRTTQELEGMIKASQAVAKTLKKMREYAHPGLSTKALDEYGYEILRQFGAVPAPKLTYGFPGWNCISVNGEAAHGIPSAKTILKEGDLVNIDVSAELDGFFGDNGGSFVLGHDLSGHNKLVEASREILYAAIARIKGGVKVADIGGFIENEARKKGFTTIKNLLGHGIGRKLHDKPHELPNFYDRRNKQRFKKNTVIALETFISTKARRVYTMEDGWTLKAPLGSYVAQHEHTLVVTDHQPIILTKENGI